MITGTTTSIDREAILAHFQRRFRDRDGDYVRYLAYHLIKMTLDRREFDALESLIA